MELGLPFKQARPASPMNESFVSSNNDRVVVSCGQNARQYSAIALDISYGTFYHWAGSSAREIAMSHSHGAIPRQSVPECANMLVVTVIVS